MCLLICVDSSRFELGAGFERSGPVSNSPLLHYTILYYTMLYYTLLYYAILCYTSPQRLGASWSIFMLIVGNIAFRQSFTSAHRGQCV